MICVRCRVSGKVQGVWFRGSTQQQAQTLGLSGHARNLDGGDVEVLACGNETAISQLKAWLWKGPPLARVDEVVCEKVDVTPPAGFTTR